MSGSGGWSRGAVGAAIGLGAVVLGLTVALILALSGDDVDTASPRYVPPTPTEADGYFVLLEPAGDTGPLAFLTLADRQEAPGFTTPTVPEGVDPPPGADGELGLYGGTVEQACDQELLVWFLANNPEKARAWADVLEIEVAEIPGYVRSLRPAVLEVDTRVTNHGYANGVAIPRQTVLEAGTAVLLDEFGAPRVRCYCGNPLTDPLDAGSAGGCCSVPAVFPPLPLVSTTTTTTTAPPPPPPPSTTSSTTTSSTTTTSTTTTSSTTSTTSSTSTTTTTTLPSTTTTSSTTTTLPPTTTTTSTTTTSSTTTTTTLPPTTTTSSTTTTTLPPPPEITVTKTPGEDQIPEPGKRVLFAVKVSNTGPVGVSLDSLSDSVFGDLLNVANPAVVANNCPNLSGATIGVGGFAQCTFQADLAGGPADPPHMDEVLAQVTATDGSGQQAFGTGVALVSFVDVPPTVSITVTASQGQVTYAAVRVAYALPYLAVAPGPGVSVPEPGGPAYFTVEVTNTSNEAVDVLSLVSDPFGDLRNAGNEDVWSNTCPGQPVTIPPGGKLVCGFYALVEGSPAESPFVNSVTVKVQDDDDSQAQATGSDTVVITDVLPSITVTKTANPTSVPESGATVTFSVTVRNNSVEDVTLTDLTDDVFGDLLSAGNGSVGANTCPSQSKVIAPAGQLTCSFEAFVSGNAPGSHTDTVTAEAVDDEANAAQASGSATVTFSDSPPTITVTKTPSVEYLPLYGQNVVGFTITVTNTSTEPVTLTALSDSEFGKLLDPDNYYPEPNSNTCPPGTSKTIAPGATFVCAFNAWVFGYETGSSHTNTVTATVADGEQNPASASATATIEFKMPPTFTVSKTASPTQVAPSGETVSYTVIVTNTSGATLVLSEVSDNHAGDLTALCPGQPTTLAPGGAFTCAYQLLVAREAGEARRENNVSVTGYDPAYPTVPGYGGASAYVEFLIPT